MYSDFVFLDRFFFELSCKNTHTQTRTHTQTHTHRLQRVPYSCVFQKRNYNEYVKAIGLSKYSYELACQAPPPLHLERLQNLYYLYYYINKVKSYAFSCKLEILELFLLEVKSANGVANVQPIYPKIQDEFGNLLKVLLLTVYVLCLINISDEENITFRNHIKTLSLQRIVRLYI